MRLLKFLVILFWLLLVLAFWSFGYAVYDKYQADQRTKNSIELLIKGELGANGFGGDEGLRVINSGLRVYKYFWIDSENLAIRLANNQTYGETDRRNFVWNVTTNSFKPLDIDAPITCFRDGYFYHGSPRKSGVNRLKRKGSVMQSTLEETEDIWITSGTKKITEVWHVPSDRHTLLWSQDCHPWFPIIPERRLESDLPEHRFRYLVEWGWIIRTPRIGPQYLNKGDHIMGFFDLGGHVYSDQLGSKTGELVGYSVADLIGLDVVYLGFLDKYWMAIRNYKDESETKFIGLLSRNGNVEHIPWSPVWKSYWQYPLPTRKGLVWSGRDFRRSNDLSAEYGTFISLATGSVHKVVQGITLDMLMSSDGCSVAFTSSPSNQDRANTTLKVFNACSSTTQGRGLQDAKY